MVISHPLSASSIYYDPWHPLCSIYVLDSLFARSLSKFSLVCLLAWYPPLHTPCISSPNHCLLFATCATATACSAVVPRLCPLILVSLSTLYFFTLHFFQYNIFYFLCMAYFAHPLTLFPISYCQLSVYMLVIDDEHVLFYVLNCFIKG